jgi:hypothetical protein
MGPAADRHDVPESDGFKGTVVTSGRGTGAVVGTLVGAGLGAAIGAASGNAGAGAAIGGATGLLGGAAIGSDQGNMTGYDMQRRYDIAYQQCMYSKGNQIPTYRQQPVRVYTPAPPPPAPGYYYYGPAPAPW